MSLLPIKRNKLCLGEGCRSIFSQEGGGGGQESNYDNEIVKEG